MLLPKVLNNRYDAMKRRINNRYDAMKRRIIITFVLKKLKINRKFEILIISW